LATFNQIAAAARPGDSHVERETVLHVILSFGG
jgi:hypothetical protein